MPTGAPRQRMSAHHVVPAFLRGHFLASSCTATPKPWRGAPAGEPVMSWTAFAAVGLRGVEVRLRRASGRRPAPRGRRTVGAPGYRLRDVPRQVPVRMPTPELALSQGAVTGRLRETLEKGASRHMVTSTGPIARRHSVIVSSSTPSSRERHRCVRRRPGSETSPDRRHP